MRKTLFFAFLFVMGSAYCQNWDVNTLKRINGWDGKFVRGYSRTVSDATFYVSLGVPLAMGIYGGMSKNEGLLKDAIYVGTTVGAAVMLSYGMKYVFDRKRPYDKYPGVIIPRGHESTPAFPSGHTAAAFSLATSLSITYPKWYVIAPCAVWAASVGFARMNQGLHYPSDVIGGAIIGSGTAVVNIYVNKWLNNWLFPEKKKGTPIVY